MNIFLSQQFITYVLSAQKNRLIETVLFSTHMIRFVCEIKISKVTFNYTLLTRSLLIIDLCSIFWGMT